MNPSITTMVSGHVTLDEAEQFNITGRTYSSSPERQIRVDDVRPVRAYGADYIGVSGRRVLKSGRLGDQRLTMRFKTDNEDIPAAVRHAVAALNVRMADLKAYLDEATR